MSEPRLQLEARELHAGYGLAQVLRGASVDAAGGEIVALLGPNGAGKSTLLRVVAGLLRATRGGVLLDGKPIGHLPPWEIAARGLVMVPEGGRAFEPLSVRENLELGAFLPRAHARAEETIREVFALFPILETRQREHAENLSGGERQMLALGGGLMACRGCSVSTTPSSALGAKSRTRSATPSAPSRRAESRCSWPASTCAASSVSPTAATCSTRGAWRSKAAGPRSATIPDSRGRCSTWGATSTEHPRGAEHPNGPERPRGMLRRVKAKWLFVILAPTMLLMAGSVLALLFLPHPVPKTATAVQRAYLTRCATCHGANGRGSWRATIFFIRPGDLTDREAMSRLSDDYLFGLIKNGGATIGKPGMPAFGYHLTDPEISALVAHVRMLSAPK
jgi:ABC-type lipoprotein export system ATPase subunit/mono/diheme cytochrome c family protein